MLMQKIKILITLVIIVMSVTFVPSVAYAQVNEIKGGVNSAAGSGGDPNDINTTITAVINLLSSIVGILAVVMLIVGGFRYITSNGDSNKVGSAKNTVIYALIGVAIVALAQVIVQFVLNKTT